MLVLSRKKDESIIIDGQIEIQVLKIKGNNLMLFPLAGVLMIDMEHYCELSKRSAGLRLFLMN